MAENELPRRLEAVGVTLVVGCSAGITEKEAAMAVAEMEKLLNATGRYRVWIGIEGFKPFESILPETNNGPAGRSKSD